MAELWSFENVASCTYVRDVTIGTTESSSKSKSIWPIQIYLHLELIEMKGFHMDLKIIVVLDDNDNNIVYQVPKLNNLDFLCQSAW